MWLGLQWRAIWKYSAILTAKLPQRMLWFADYGPSRIVFNIETEERECQGLWVVTKFIMRGPKPYSVGSQRRSRIRINKDRWKWPVKAHLPTTAMSTKQRSVISWQTPGSWTKKDRINGTGENVLYKIGFSKFFLIYQIAVDQFLQVNR